MPVTNPYAGSPASHAASHAPGGADAVTLPQYDRDQGQAGLLFPTSTGWNYARAALSNRGYLVRGRTSRALNVVSAAFVVTTASGTDDPVEIAVYSGDLSTKLATTGAVTGLLNNGTGRKTTPLTVTLAGNTTYYVYFGSTSTVGAVHNASFDVSVGANRIFGVSAPQVFAGDTTYPSPSTPTPGVAVNVFPIVALLES